MHGALDPAINSKLTPVYRVQLISIKYNTVVPGNSTSCTGFECRLEYGTVTGVDNYNIYYYSLFCTVILKTKDKTLKYIFGVTSQE